METDILDDLVVLNENTLFAPSETEDEPAAKKRSLLFDDIFHRPASLKHLNTFTMYEKHIVPKSKTSYKEFHRFAREHPQYLSHCMKKISDSETQRVPVLIGIPIPRSDKEEDKEAHQVAMLTLFTTWSSNTDSPLKAQDKDWSSAYEAMLTTLSPGHLRVIKNMQLLYESRDAKHDFSAMRRKRMAELASNPFNEQGREKEG
ncbi:hypothetical protein R3P38DRAFT_2773431 [Favolaschia claudopus]|uniref:Uncharacterized protein n=1 Tax=Favolaschia claudopus TaxID=2862362 RepID=A0AAW0C1E0_9AGAR